MPAQRAAKAAATLALSKAYTKPILGLATRAKATTSLKTGGVRKKKADLTTTTSTADVDTLPTKRKAVGTTVTTAKTRVKKEVVLKRALETADDVSDATRKPTQPGKRGKGKGKSAAASKAEEKVDKFAIVSHSYSSGDVTDEQPTPPTATSQPRKRRKGAAAATTERLVNPTVSNAPLAAKADSGVVIESTVLPDPHLPSTLLQPDLLKKAQEHLIRVNPNLKSVIERHPNCHVFSEGGLSEVVDPFRSLVSGIISQQVSGAAARSIKAKFVSLFDITSDEESPGGFPTPAQCLEKSIETLRTAGLSQRKAEYIQGLSEKFVSGELTNEHLLLEPDDVVVDKLVQVRGIGQWSAEMFLCFGLKRCDVFSLGDLGIQRGGAILAGRDVTKLKNTKGKWKYMAESDLEKLAEPFKPYRSVLMWYLWRLGETDIGTMTK